ncbi:hypothetical protein QFZ94_008017 [Paraburkholderia sp. JPY465]
MRDLRQKIEGGQWDGPREFPQRPVARANS